MLPPQTWNGTSWPLVDRLLIYSWKGTKTDLSEFICELSENTRNIRLTYGFNLVLIPFLDLRVTKKHDLLDTSTFHKPTAVNTLLRADSFHPRSLVKGIPMAQFLHILRNCSSDSVFKKEAHDMYARFRERGYSHNILRTAKKRAMNLDRSSLNTEQSPLTSPSVPPSGQAIQQ